jgi:S-adenosyl-L-methionine hydrolase (adenosine-forming)
MNLITLTTDFGTRDWFVGSMKGVILGVNPQAVVVDITHEIPPGNIRAGAFALAASCRCFPRNSVHVAVVDPGVGNQRAAIVVKTSDYCFVGPDNGILSLALAREKVLEIWQAENENYFHQPVSHTFHGRDIFAPVAAHLTHRVLMDSLGPPLKDYVKLDWPKPQSVGELLRGEIVYIDHFGNAISNIESPEKSAGTVRVPDKVQCDLKKFYQEVPAGQPLAVLGSTGYLEIAVNGGNAAQTYSLKLGDPVELA